MLQKCTVNGVEGYKWGEDGKCFVGVEAKQRAMREGGRVKTAAWKKKPRKLNDRVNLVKQEEKRRKNLKKKSNRK